MELGEGYDLRYREGAQREEAILAQFISGNKTRDSSLDSRPTSLDSRPTSSSSVLRLHALRDVFVLASTLSRADFSSMDQGASASSPTSSPTLRGQEGTTSSSSLLPELSFIPEYDVHAAGVRVEIKHSPPIPRSYRGTSLGTLIKGIHHPQLKAILAAEAPVPNQIQTT